MHIDENGTLFVSGEEVEAWKARAKEIAAQIEALQNEQVDVLRKIGAAQTLQRAMDTTTAT